MASTTLEHHTLISCSKAVQEYVKRRFGRDSIVIYPPVPKHIFNKFSRTRRENLVVTISRISPEKNLELIGYMGPKIPQAKFILIGGAHPQSLPIVSKIKGKFKEQGLSGNFMWLGRVSEEVKRNILSRAKVYFHPAPYESFSISIVEAMAAGAIPVAHNSGGSPEIVPKEYLFLTCQEAIEKVRLAMGNWSRNVSEDLTLEAMGFHEDVFKRKILEITNKLLESKKKEDHIALDALSQI